VIFQLLLPLHEHNSSSAAAPMEEEESEHERRRSCERFASFPRSSTPRGANRRHHQPRKSRSRPNVVPYESKENDQRVVHHHHHLHMQQREEESTVPNANHSFLQLHPQVHIFGIQKPKGLRSRFIFATIMRKVNF